LLPYLSTRTSALGLVFGTGSGVFRAAQGFEEMVLHAEKPAELQGKRATTRICEIT
jgi:hypothetical protein